MPRQLTGEELFQMYLRLRVEDNLTDAVVRSRILALPAGQGLTRASLRAALLGTVDETLASP
eukprot:5187296-Heterocapsa_arctica.AAC.1